MFFLEWGMKTEPVKRMILHNYAIANSIPSDDIENSYKKHYIDKTIPLVLKFMFLHSSSLFGPICRCLYRQQLRTATKPLGKAGSPRSQHRAFTGFC